VEASIVIVSYNGRDFLRRCLASFYHHTKGVDFEVIVVDNASTDGTPEMVVEEFPRATLVRRTENAGFARGVNQGMAVARGEAFLLLNPDTELDADILPPMLAYLRRHADIGVLAPKLLDPDGSLQLSCRAFPGFATALFNRYSLLTRLFGGNRFSRRYLMTGFDHTRTADVDWASAACWLIPRVAFEKVGPLDEGYFWSIEDVDYCQRVHRAGLRVVYFPEVAVRHHIGESAATLPGRTIRERHRGMWRYYRSYLRPQSAPARALLDAAVWLGIQARCAAQLMANGLRRMAGRR
jgi:hypothetical protein